MKLGSLSLLAGVLLLLAGCGTARPYLYGNDSCNASDQMPYPTANGRAVICMEKQSAAYILCVRELSLANIDHVSKTDVDASLKILDKAEATTKVSVENSLEQAWASETVLNQARANAIGACLNIRKEGSWPLLPPPKEAATTAEPTKPADKPN